MTGGKPVLSTHALTLIKKSLASKHDSRAAKLCTLEQLQGILCNGVICQRLVVFWRWLVFFCFVVVIACLYCITFSAVAGKTSAVKVLLPRHRPAVQGGQAKTQASQNHHSESSSAVSAAAATSTSSSKDEHSAAAAASSVVVKKISQGSATAQHGLFFQYFSDCFQPPLFFSLTPFVLHSTPRSLIVLVTPATCRAQGRGSCRARPASLESRRARLQASDRGTRAMAGAPPAHRPSVPQAGG